LEWASDLQQEFHSGQKRSPTAKSVGAKVDRTVIIDSMDIPLEYTGTLNVNTRVVRIVGANEIIAIGTV
jgi:hypothetical protein